MSQRNSINREKTNTLRKSPGFEQQNNFMEGETEEKKNPKSTSRKILQRNSSHREMPITLRKSPRFFQQQNKFAEVETAKPKNPKFQARIMLQRNYTDGEKLISLRKSPRFLQQSKPSEVEPEEPKSLTFKLTNLNRRNSLNIKKSIILRESPRFQQQKKPSVVVEREELENGRFNSKQLPQRNFTNRENSTSLRKSSSLLQQKERWLDYETEELKNPTFGSRKLTQRNSTNRENPYTLRRSSRIQLQNKPTGLGTEKPKNHGCKSKNNQRYPPKAKLDPLLTSRGILSSKKYHVDRANKASNENSECLRRSLRLVNEQTSHGFFEESSEEKPNVFIDSNSGELSDREVLSEVEKDIFIVKPYSDMTVKVEKKKDRIDEWSREIGVSREATQDDEGWTEDQKLALQSAYFAAKPSPHFWKKVAKLVPGKSAQECFDRVNSDHLTPTHPQPRSRLNRTYPTILLNKSLSIDELLNNPIELNARKAHGKQKMHLARKTARQLLQKQYNVNRENDADFFPILEPTSLEPGKLIPIPDHAFEKSEILENCSEKHSSGKKKHFSEPTELCGEALVSPPVLKQVKNMALHEKYIDLLHCREAKRKAESSRAGNCFPGKADAQEKFVQKVDVIKVAKTALVCDARDAINQFQNLQANALSNSCDFDDGFDRDDDDESEDET